MSNILPGEHNYVVTCISITNERYFLFFPCFHELYVGDIINLTCPATGVEFREPIRKRELLCCELMQLSLGPVMMSDLDLLDLNFLLIKEYRDSREGFKGG